MDRVTLRIPKKQVEEVEALVESGEYPNRSEVIRTAVRDLLREEKRRGAEENERRPWLSTDGGQKHRSTSDRDARDGFTDYRNR